MKKLVIDRGNWLTGTAEQLATGGDGFLLDSKTGLQCCVGIYGSACGVPKAGMRDRPVFYHHQAAEWPELKWLTEYKPGSNVCPQELLAEANDTPAKKMHASRREAKIKKLFKLHGDVDVTFVGKYATATKKAQAANAAMREAREFR